MEANLKSVATGYVRLFPELLDRFYKNNDLTIVDLIVDKTISLEKTKKMINVNTIKKDTINLLKNGI